MDFTISMLLGSSYSLLSLFFLTIAASWIIIPAMGVILVSFGAAAANFHDLVNLILLIYFATLIGDLTVYFVARRFSKNVLGFLRRFKWFSKNEKSVRPLIRKYGFYLVFVSRFLNTEVCLVANYIAGFEKIDYRKFASAVVIGELIYAITYASFGYFFKDSWNYLLGVVQNFSWVIISGLIGIYLIYRIIKKMRKNGKGRTNKTNKAK